MLSQKTAKSAIMRLIDKNKFEWCVIGDIPNEMVKSGDVDKTKSVKRCVSRAIADLEKNKKISVRRNSNGDPISFVKYSPLQIDTKEVPMPAVETAHTVRHQAKADGLTKSLRMLQSRFPGEARFTVPQALETIAECMQITINNARHRESQLRILKLTRMVSTTEMVVTSEKTEVTLADAESLRGVKYLAPSKSVQEFQESMAAPTVEPAPTSESIEVTTDEEPAENVFFDPAVTTRMMLEDIQRLTRERDELKEKLETAMLVADNALRDLEISRTAYRDLDQMHTALIQESSDIIDSVSDVSAALKAAKEANAALETKLEQLKQRYVPDDEVLKYLQSRSQ